MGKIIKEDVSVGTSIYGIFNRMPQKLERVFAEFIDNSTQSFNDHKDELKALNKSAVCKITITWSNNEIVILDNACGMSHDEFKHALKLNDPRTDYSKNSRSQYGMGLKTAATYLGKWYSIETTKLGSNEKYYSEIDVDYFEKNNPTEVDNVISECAEEDHYTKITIKNLQQKFSNSIDKNLKKKLALIYKNDLDNGELEIKFNGQEIQSVDPELRINKETGEQYLSHFEDEFEFNGKKYNYFGWVGILKEGSTDDAGFTLSQYERGIMLNYRPQEVFGKSNSFQYQRVVGEIKLIGDGWKITFNKDKFIWDDGLEKAFIDSLKDNHEIKIMSDIAGHLRKDNDIIKPVIKQKDAKKITENISTKFSSLKDVKKTNIKEPTNDEPIIIDENLKEKEPNIMTITYLGSIYSFDVQIKNDNLNDPWLQVKRKDENNSFYVVINGLTEYFKEFRSKECQKLIVGFAVSLALTQLTCPKHGVELSESAKVMNELNEILKNVK